MAPFGVSVLFSMSNEEIKIKEIKAVERLSNIVKYSTQRLYCVLAVLTETLASYQT